MSGIRDEWTTEDGSVRLLLGDCLEILPGLGKVDCVVTDPPYGMRNDCDYTRFTMGPNGHGKASSRKYDSIIGDDEPFDPTPWLAFQEVILWGFNHFAARLPVGTTLAWIKRFDGGFGSFLSDAELAWKKGGCGVYCHRDTSLMAETHSRAHPTQKPVGLMEWCVAKTKGQSILDPFMGSGTTGVACIRLGRRFVGIEKEPKYFEIAKKRIREELAKTALIEKPRKLVQASFLEPAACGQS